ncbi:hypothetical protein AT1G78030 [Arabidopsis thaliana]|uniref:Uncharacterized protein n=1 Tax=Arabidopsis thaliana TaxID=3702 RepID=F4I8M5_ARATH|nr:uncharacterized protein AT1G78030 [Arabidopsis thaliana]AEE36059.2 hypothetical protein AT1G78030 [Arabidopsis thaliana]|eukprot:NP_001319400.1 hypothetical protein AT1G78030 [Arabidopsis thaliana]
MISNMLSLLKDMKVFLTFRFFSFFGSLKFCRIEPNKNSVRVGSVIGFKINSELNRFFSVNSNRVVSINRENRSVMSAEPNQTENRTPIIILPIVGNRNRKNRFVRFGLFGLIRNPRPNELYQTHIFLNLRVRVITLPFSMNGEKSPPITMTFLNDNDCISHQTTQRPKLIEDK